MIVGIRERMIRVIEKYNMFSSNVVPVAFSGGKDSATCIFLLSESGFDVRPVIVDRADDEIFDSKIISNALKAFGYSANILNLRDVKFLSSLPQQTSNSIIAYLSEIDSLEKGGIACTPCYNARTLALSQFAVSLDANEYVLGMHKTDFLTSFLRFYWIDCYYESFTKKMGLGYDVLRMKDLISCKEIDLDYLEKMVRERKAASDDPPVEILSNDIKIVRPLVEISERDIFSFVKKINYPHTSTNCKFRQDESATPLRLIVQWDLTNRINSNPNIEEELYYLAMKSINEDGTLQFRPRNDLHINYPGFDSRVKCKL